MTLSHLLILLASLTALTLVNPAPVPIPKERNNVVEEEDGLIVLVPTVPVDEKGQPTKREVDYELISIPGELIRKTVKEVTNSYGTRGGPLPEKDSGLNGAASIYLSGLQGDDDDDEIVIKAGVTKDDGKIVIKTDLGDLTESSSSNLIQGAFNLDSDDFLKSFDDISIKVAPSSYGDDSREKGHRVVSTTDLSKILSGLASTGFSTATSGANIASHAKNALSTATRVGASAVKGGSQAVRWVLDQKASGLRTFARVAGTGLRYAGRLSSAILKVLLRIPGIKAKIISDLIQAGQPLASAVSDVIVESADDLGDIFSAQSDVFKDAINVLFRLIQDVLSLQGRVIASFSAGGLDKGANLISSSVKVGSAFVQAAGDVASSVGRGIGELVQVISEADLPPPPALPSFSFPVIPKITFPDSGEKYGSPSSLSYKSPSLTIYTSSGERID